MKTRVTQIAIVSGKGGTGKTTLTASFALLGRPCVLADCDVDAADLHLLMAPTRLRTEEFRSGRKPVIDRERCTGCGRCAERCRFSALEMRNGLPAYDAFACEGCGLCARVCEAGAIEMREQRCGEWYVSETACGPMAHARLGIAEENSGKLVTTVRREAVRLAEERGLRAVLIDGPPGIGCPVISSIVGADLVVAVTEPTLSGLHDLERVAGLAARFGIRTAVCVNKFDINEEMSGRIGAYCREGAIALLGRIPYDRAVVESLARGEPVIRAAGSAAAAAVRGAWERLRAEAGWAP
ncbi:MAG: ATP-binding protein [bacterium]|nr:ATP-binding protein [bacterium]